MVAYFSREPKGSGTGKSVLILLTFLPTIQGSYAAVFGASPTEIKKDRSAERGSGDFHFYYYGDPIW